nr:MAG TPA: hypothetical protein [Caudoviricetes sp.]
MRYFLKKYSFYSFQKKIGLLTKLFTNRNSPKTKSSFWGYSYGASIHKKQLGNPHKIKAFGIRQTDIASLY